MDWLSAHAGFEPNLAYNLFSKFFKLAIEGRNDLFVSGFQLISHEAQLNLLHDDRLDSLVKLGQRILVPGTSTPQLGREPHAFAALCQVSIIELVDQLQ